MAVQLADGRYVMSKEEAETYVRNNADVVLAISQGQFANASDHFNRYGQFEDRDGSPDTDDLDASVIDGSGFLYTNNMDINNPLADPLYRELTGSPDPTGGGDDSGGGTNNNQGGGTNNNQGGGGIMSSPVGLEAGALDPVTNLIGTTDSTGQYSYGKTGRLSFRYSWCSKHCNSFSRTSNYSSRHCNSFSW
jgi:hypothetical protein